MKKLLLFLAFVTICSTTVAQDLIVCRDAEEINAKVLRSGGSKIEYTLSGNSGGTVYTISSRDVLYVKYGDGRKEVFDNTPAIPKRLLAQYKDSYPHYQGEVSVGYALGVGQISKYINTSRVVVETVHGVRLSPYAFFGAGVGLNYFYGSKSGDKASDGAGVGSVFVNAKGYYPVSKGTSLYLSADLGASVGVWNMPDMADIYTAVGPGVSIGNPRDRLRFDLGVRYQYMGTGTSAVLFRIGLGF